MIRLVFNNEDATPKTAEVECSSASVPAIMAWYNAYHAGDQYTVVADGRKVPMDQNGEPLPRSRRETMMLKVIQGSGQRTEDLTGEMAERIREVIYEYGGRLPLAAAVGVLTIVQHELIADADDAP
jgi:hypothetical protein